MGLHCSHFHGRGKWGIRFDPDNCEALCYGCHSHLGQKPALHRDRKLKLLGQEAFDALQQRANDIKLGRGVKRAQKEVAAHYRHEHKGMLEKRSNGVTCRLAFGGWQCD